MADSQDIFLLLLIILFLANAQDDSGSGFSSINTVILILMLFGTLNTRNDNSTANDRNRRVCCPSACPNRRG